MAKLESAIKEKTVSFISPKKTKQTIQNVVWKKVAIQGLFDQPFNDLLFQAIKFTEIILIQIRFSLALYYQLKRVAVLKIVDIAPSRQGTIRRLIMSQL